MQGARSSLSWVIPSGPLTENSSPNEMRLQELMQESIDASENQLKIIILSKKVEVDAPTLPELTNEAYLLTFLGGENENYVTRLGSQSNFET